jgi:hypothetical protein
MHDSIGGDLLRGAQAIADFVGLKLRDAFDKLEKGYLPATKEGHLWVASKSALRAHYRVPPIISSDTNSDATDDHAEAPPTREARPTSRSARAARRVARRGGEGDAQPPSDRRSEPAAQAAARTAIA